MRTEYVIVSSGWLLRRSACAGSRILLLFIALVLAPATRGDARDYDQDMRTLAERKDVQEAFRVIESLEGVSESELIELTEIPAPPYQESKRARRFASMLRDAGMADVAIDEQGNVLTRWHGTSGARTVALVAHLDTVFPAGTDVEVRREGDKLFAPGVGDNSRGLVVMLSLIKAMQASRIATRDDILFVASVGEEGIGDLRGVKYLHRAGGPRIDEFIAIDGGSDERVVNHAIGSIRYRLVFNGPGGHSWGAFGLANPAHALSRAIYYFDLEASDFVESGIRTSYNIGRVGGGTSVNSIPFESWAEVDMRSENPARLELIDAIFHRCVARALEEANDQRDRGEPLSVDVETLGRRPSGIVAPETPLIQRALAATRYFGIEPELGSGSTDANVAIALGIPATTISRGGSSGGAHSLDEWWSGVDGHIGIQKALLITLASTGVVDQQR